ncbi:hypothetical protein EXW34_06610 [Bacillus mycoides]|uniref:DUF6997 domain-containing protein n=1 Tax=Bacillus mycoides TaxID=1405 RepID=UPI0002799757|nr:hypothetical protein [Bacillus mycoides]EJS10513.1 hypothetical protein IKO_00734 [Bacillus cereus VDM034]QWI21027.1 hypothetical protein EXW34_06610 [Bacillus mycoides]
MDKKYEYNGMSSVFYYAIDQLANIDQGIFGPVSFLDYLSGLGFPKLRAPDAISIDSWERLHQSLKDSDSMLLRLGKSTGVGTQFAVVKIKNRLSEYFLFDEKIFTNDGVEYIPEVEDNQLLAYQLLPTLTEASIVNLGFTSGLISKALGLDEVKPIFPPATCNSTFTFSFKPHSSLDIEVIHNKGQVEIDAMFVGKRNNVDTLFVVEAKIGSTHKSLAKHKLLYPVLAVAPQIPEHMPIVPVYLKVQNKKSGIHFHVVECEIPDPRKRMVAYDELQLKQHTHYILPSQLLEYTEKK